MTDDRPPKPLDVVSMLRSEFQSIHGPLPDEAKIDPDERLREFFAQVHALCAPPSGPDGEPAAQPPKHESRSALCLSGGGIRSASFSLGVLQGLARAGVLHRFHYLSTVSGGGYIGAWLTAWIHRCFEQHAPSSRTPALLDGLCRAVAMRPGGPSATAATPDANPEVPGGPLTGATGLGADDPPEPPEVAYLRRFTNYLTPRTGAFSVDTWTLVVVYLRNLLLNWLVVLPLVGALIAVPHVIAAALATVVATDAAVLATVLLPPVVLVVALAGFVVWDAFEACSTDIGAVEWRARQEGRLFLIAVCWAGAVAAQPHEAYRDPRWYMLDELPRAEPKVPEDVVEVIRRAQEALQPEPPAPLDRDHTRGRCGLAVAARRHRRVPAGPLQRRLGPRAPQGARGAGGDARGRGPTRGGGRGRSPADPRPGTPRVLVPGRGRHRQRRVLYHAGAGRTGAGPAPRLALARGGAARGGAGRAVRRARGAGAGGRTHQGRRSAVPARNSVMIEVVAVPAVPCYRPVPSSLS